VLAPLGHDVRVRPGRIASKGLGHLVQPRQQLIEMVPVLVEYLAQPLRG
jgi:hypothetical protein